MGQQTNPDNALWQQIIRDDKKALELLFAKYFAPLCRFTDSFVGNQMMAEELVADIFFGLWSKRKQLEIHTSLRAYLFATARNTALNHLRGKEPGKIIYLHEQPVEPGLVEGVDAGLEYYELLEQVEGIIDKMPKKRQEIFRMHKLEGLKYHEIADRLSISVRTVQNQMIEAKKYMSQFNVFL